MNINSELNDLIKLLDENKDIKKISEINEKIDDKLIKEINDYRLNPTIEKKNKLLENKLFQEYLISENNLNFLIMEINSKFKKGKICESNKW